MDFLDFSDVSFRPNNSIGRLCEDLNHIVGYGIWYDTFQVQNTQWLWLVNNIVTTITMNILKNALLETCSISYTKQTVIFIHFRLATKLRYHLQQDDFQKYHRN